MQDRHQELEEELEGRVPTRIYRLRRIRRGRLRVGSGSWRGIWSSKSSRLSI